MLGLGKWKIIAIVGGVLLIVAAVAVGTHRIYEHRRRERGTNA